MVRKLRIFISSPGDVGQERLIATRVIERLQGEFAGYVELEPILWEHEPLRATAHFQEQIIPPSETDIVVCILWSRLGTRLPDQFRRPDGSLYASGTEWEFEDALESFRTRGTPDLMVYRKTAEPRASMSDEAALMQRLQQKKALDLFIDHWFGNPKDSFRAAFHTFDAPDAFETVLESHLRRLIQEKLPAYLTEEGGAITPIQWFKGSPFRGLEAFDIEHAPVFFGRTRAISSIKEALTHQASRGSAFILILGMSGCGKSSLIRAGVVPTILQPGIIEGIGVWRWSSVRPSDAPEDLFAGIAFALLESTALPELAEIGYDAKELAALFHESPARAIGALQMGVKRAAEAVATAEGRSETPQMRIALVVDQLEEIFTLPRLTSDDRSRFISALGALARSGLVWVVATMRSDFYPYCVDLPELSELKKGEGQYDVLPANFAEIGQMIRYPARAAGVRFEVRPDGEKLDETLLEAAARNPEGLPLLSFTLDELYQQRTEENLLTFAAYERLGGLEGALARRAEEVFTTQSREAQETLPNLLRWLVTVSRSGDDLAAARRVPLSLVATTPARKALLDAFIAARLLITDRDDNGEPVVRVAHEALLRHWPRLQDWLAEDKSFLHTRERIVASALRWREEGRRQEYLLPEGKPLADALDVLKQRREDLDQTIIDYIELSGRAVATARRRTFQIGFGIAAVFCLVVLGFGLHSFSEWQRTAKQKKLALTAIDRLTYEVPRRLIDIPESRPVLREIFENNVKLLDQIIDTNSVVEKRVNYEYMGDMWLLFGDTDRAKEAYEQSLKLAEAEAKDTSNANARKALAACQTRMGDVLKQRGEIEPALTYYRQSLSLLQNLSEMNTKDATVQHDLSVAYEKIGDVHSALGQPADALGDYQRSLDIARGTATSGSGIASSPRELAVSFEKFGDARFATGDLPGAKEAFETGLKLLERENRSAPTRGTKRDLLATHSRLGDIYRKSGDIIHAQQSYDRSLALARELAKDRSDQRALRDLSACFASYIDLRIAQGDINGALAVCQQSLQIAERATYNSNDVAAKQNRQYLYERLRDIQFMKGDIRGGSEAQEKSLLLALELAKRENTPAARRKQADIYQTLGAARTERGDARGAAEAYRQASDLFRDLTEKESGKNSLVSTGVEAPR